MPCEILFSFHTAHSWCESRHQSVSCECVNICCRITTQCPKAKKKKGEHEVCIKPVCAQICQLSCWCRGSGIIPSPRLGSEDWSMHFLSLLSVTRPVKGFMARICTQTYTHQCTPSGRTNTYAKGPHLKLFSCNPLPRPSKHTHISQSYK